MPEQQQHASNLRAAQASSLKNSAQTIQKNAKAAMNVASLATYIDPFMDWLFGISLLFAVIKDILDLIDTALYAAGGEILIIITTLLCSIIIGFVMLLTGSSGKNKLTRTVTKRILLLLGTTIVEMLPGIDILPLESLVVIIIIWMTLTERKAGTEKSKPTKTPQTQPEPARA